jgi:hypothetical protein
MTSVQARRTDDGRPSRPATARVPDRGEEP